MNPQVGILAQNTGLAAPQVVPLLQALNRAEEMTAALAMRLDPITNHEPTDQSAVPPNMTVTMTVTGRLHTLGNTLQYLLDHIEL